MSPEPGNLPDPTSPGALVKRVWLRLRAGGLGWLVERVNQEIRSPYTAVGRAINGGLRRVQSLGRSVNSGRKSGDGRLLAVYDLMVEPMTFDFLFFLLAAEKRRIELGAKSIAVVLAAGDGGGLREETESYRRVIDVAAQRDRLVNILMPCASLLPSVSGIEMISDRRALEARIRCHPGRLLFPDHYSLTLHRSSITDFYRDVLKPECCDSEMAALRASEGSLRYVDDWLKARGVSGRFVTITMRRYQFNPDRNSNGSAWAEIAAYLRARGIEPVFVHDTETLAEGVPKPCTDFLSMPEASISVLLRMALYERAFVNLGISSGPLFLAFLNRRCRALMLKIITPGVHQNEALYIAGQGFVIGGQIPFCTPFQRRVWKDDRFDVIRDEFEAMEALIDAKDRAGRAS